MKHARLLALGFLGTSAFASVSNTDQLIEAKKQENKAIYEHLHMNPELSLKEVETSKLMAAEMTKLGFEVTTNVGGYGVVAVLRNGAGPTALIRADMDALPVQEETGLPYSSKVPGVMHACGHDMHMAVWLGTAHVLANSKDRWSGTLVMIAQPAEEIVAGAKAMIADGLFTRFPKPDYGIALHTQGRALAGDIWVRAGFIQASTDPFYVKLTGKGTHGAAPHSGISPIQMMAELQAKLNSVVSLEVDPTQPVVMDLGKFVAGTKGNVIPEYAEAEGTIRAYDPNVRAYLKTRLEQVAAGIALLNNAPTAEVKWLGGTNPNYNDPNLAAIAQSVFQDVFGKVGENPMAMTSEDFAEYAPAGNMPTLFFYVGTAAKVPAEFVNHSPKFAPVFDPTYKHGVKAMAEAVMRLQK